MKKIAVLTLFHNSTNYGGNLQAYALCTALNRMGFQAEQLRIDCYEDCYPILTLSKSKLLFSKAKRVVKRPIKRIALKILPSYRAKKALQFEKRRALLDAFHRFNYDLTPHSGTVYTTTSVRKANSVYDAFVTGSDQVWNPKWYFPPFFLDFVSPGTPKLAYAASIAQNQLPEWIQDLYRKHLQNFTAISVREEAAVSLLKGIAPGEVRYVLDPTLLLSKEDWDQVAAPVQVQSDYVFCYFLGDDLKMRQVAAQYAKKQGLTLITIPHATGLFHVNDQDYGDLALPAPSPEEFISLIKHARYVFTDSFHASVFSLIYERQFVVFAREGNRAMGSRLNSLTSLFRVPERFCDTDEKATLSHLEALPPIDYSVPVPQLAAARQESLDFLRKNLSLTE